MRLLVPSRAARRRIRPAWRRAHVRPGAQRPRWLRGWSASMRYRSAGTGSWRAPPGVDRGATTATRASADGVAEARGAWRTLGDRSTPGERRPGGRRIALGESYRSSVRVRWGSPSAGLELVGRARVRFDDLTTGRTTMDTSDLEKPLSEAGPTTIRPRPETPEHWWCARCGQWARCDDTDLCRRCRRHAPRRE